MSLEEVIRYEPTLLDSLLTFRTLTHQIPPRRSLKSPKSAVLKSRVKIILFVMLPPHETLNSTISWSLQAKDVPSQSFVYIGPAIQSSLLVSSSSVSKYYHSALREVLGLCCLSSRYQFPMRARPVILSLLSAIYQRPHCLPLPAQVAHSTHTQLCHPC